MRVTRFLWLLILCLVAPLGAAEKGTMVISYIDHPKSANYFSLIIKSYNDIGFRVELVKMPTERRLMALDEGLVDADLIASANISKRFDNLVKVHPTIGTASLFLLCRVGLKCDLDLLKDENATIYSGGGAKNAAEELFSPVKAKIKTLEIETTLLKMIALGRIDYLLWPDVKGSLEGEVKLRIQYIEVGQLSIFHFMHKKHIEHKPALEKALARNLKILKEGKE